MADRNVQSPTDPLAPVLRPAIRPTVEVLLDEFDGHRRYRDEDFPMDAERFDGFRRDAVDGLVDALGLGDWRVASDDAKQDALEGRFEDHHLETLRHHGIEMEVHAIELADPGVRIPAVLCFPEGGRPAPGICCYSGHSKHGLRDLVLDLDSYQAGIAVRLARAGFATIAVEKVDSGYLSRGFSEGVDEVEIATHQLAWGRTTRAVQLRACLAACEILACSPRVDENRIGATGVSLGGWLSTETALLTDRIKAVADFGRKTGHVAPGVSPADYKGVADMCHILPGMLSLCDRNLHVLAYCPRPMLAGHGRRDVGSHEQGPVRFRRIFERQYAALGFEERYEYCIHDGGDDMPADDAVRYFERFFRTR